MKHTGKMMSAALLLGTIGCLCGGISQLSASAEGDPAWIDITPTSKYVYTLDASNTKAAFAFDVNDNNDGTAGNNAWGKTIIIDLGMQSDGETEEEDQCYTLSKIKFQRTVNVNSVTVDISMDNVNYSNLATITGFSAWAGKEADFDTEVQARYVRLKSEDNWATFYGSTPFSFYGYASEFVANDDPEGLTLVGIDENTVYPLVKGDTVQLNAQMSNINGEGEITYALADEADGISVTADGLLTIGAVGDGETEYTVTASVPNPNDEDAPYTASMKFVVLEEELTTYGIYYQTGNTYDLLDYIALDVARVFGSGEIEYSVDGTTYAALTANEALLAPVVVRYIRTSNDFVLYGTSSALTVEEITSEDINGFYPEHPLADLIDGDLLTVAQTPNSNLLGEGEVLGSITLELDGYYKINAVRVFSMWNSIAGGFISFSLDGVTFTGETDLNLHYVSCKLGESNAEFMDIVVPEGEVAAKYVRLNITAASTQEVFMAAREFNAYGETMPEVTLSYDANTTDEVTDIPQGGEIAFGAIVDEPTAPSREGYAFKGWYKDEDCEEVFDFDAPVFEDTTLYASWIEVYTVSFEVNGGSAVTAIPVENGSSATAPEDPTKEGYAFKGWYADEELTTAYDFEAAVTEDTTLYAKWNAVYTVTFEVNGGSAVAAATVENGEAVAAPANPTKAGYAFKGWYSDEELTTAYDFTAAVMGNITVYAKWNAALTVTFEVNGGSAVADQAVESGDTATEPDAPTKAEHTFGGWYADENCTEAFDFSAAITANTTVYAKWTIVTYTVTFNTDGGSEVAAATVDSGSTLTKPEDPAKSGYSFVGWYKDEDRTEAFDFTVGITADTTLYAKWEVAVTTYAFTVNVTGEGEVLGKPYGEVNAGSVITLTFVPADGYELSSVKVNGTETEVEELKLNITVNAAVTVEVVYSQIEDQPKAEDDGLSTGAIVAISVCSACVVIGAGVAAFFVIKKRKGNS